MSSTSACHVDADLGSFMPPELFKGARKPISSLSAPLPLRNHNRNRKHNQHHFQHTKNRRAILRVPTIISRILGITFFPQKGGMRPSLLRRKGPHRDQEAPIQEMCLNHSSRKHVKPPPIRPPSLSQPPHLWNHIRMQRL